MVIHVYLHPASDVMQKLDSILEHLVAFEKKVTSMNAETQAKSDALVKELTRLTNVEQGIETLIAGMAAQIAEAGANETDPAVIAAFDKAKEIVTAVADRAAKAITDNTTA